jgi:hypothetical protein
MPWIIGNVTPRSQALYALRAFGPMTANTLFEKWACPRDTLLLLEGEGLVEKALNRQGVEWWRLTETETLPAPPEPTTM